MLLSDNPFFDVRACAEFVDSLVKTKQLHKASKSPEFPPLMRRLRSGLTSKLPSDRALALSVVGKLGVIVRGLRGEITDALSDLIGQPPPPILTLVEADDRFYAAQFWRYVRPDWAADLLAECVVEEESSETFRRECMEGLVQIHSQLASVLEAIVPRVRALSFETESPADSKARRARRILSALATAASRNKSEPGIESGANLREFLLATVRDSGPPLKSKDELTEESLAFLHYCVRAELSLLTLARVYAPLRTLKEWYTQAEWEQFVERSKDANDVAQDIEWALELLARVGIADNELFGMLLLATGSERESRRRGHSIAQRNPGLSEEINAWLHGHATRRRSSLALENQFQQADVLIADIILRQSMLNTLTEEIGTNVLPRLRILDDSSSSVIGRSLDQLRSLNATIESLASARNLSVIGSIGDVVDFAPLEHEFADPKALGARVVRVLMPMVVANGGLPNRRVVRKAVVEPAGG